VNNSLYLCGPFAGAVLFGLAAHLGARLKSTPKKKTS